VPVNRARWLLATVLAISLCAGTASVVLVDQQLGAAQRDYKQALAAVQGDLSAAARAGYADDDLAPARQRLQALRQAQLPVLVWAQATYLEDQAGRLRDLRSALHQGEARADQAARQDLDRQLASAGAGLDRDRSLQVPDKTTNGLASRLDALGKRAAGAKTIGEVRRADTDAKALVDDVNRAGAEQEAENAAIQQAADALLAQQKGSGDALRKLGGAALAGGRNDATVAAYEAKPGRFPAIDQVMAAYDRLESYAPKLGSADPKDVAFAAAALQRYAGQIHSLLLQNLGPKHIVVSFQDQHVWVYQGQDVVMESAVTTGIRGAGPYGTDFGPMKVIFTSHPWKMHSPWPKGSPYWYPDTEVQWTVFFTTSGESFHDANWEPDSELGPGSQYDLSTRSHGCIHLPLGDAQWLYGWADLNTPVDVYPGNGQPVAEQLSEITTDDQGNPLNPA
jgi:hypothetical protein